MVEPLVGALVVLGLLWGLTTLGAMVDGGDDDPSAPTLVHDLLFVVSLIYILRYLRTRRSQ